MGSPAQVLRLGQPDDERRDHDRQQAGTGKINPRMLSRCPVWWDGHKGNDYGNGGERHVDQEHCGPTENARQHASDDRTSGPSHRGYATHRAERNSTLPTGKGSADQCDRGGQHRSPTGALDCAAQDQ